MLHKGKLLIFFCTLVIALYGISAAFYGKVVARDEAYKELSVFMDVLKKINTEYVETPDMAKVQEGAMRGLMEALDPYSSYLSKESMQEMDKRKAAGNAGVGLVISKRGDVVYIISVQRNGPGDAAGLRPGDYLMTVDGVSTEDKNLVEVESLLRGAPNSPVKVTVFRSARYAAQVAKQISSQIPNNVRLTRISNSLFTWVVPETPALRAAIRHLS